MEVTKYVVERQMIYSLDNRSFIDTIAVFDNFIDALYELEKTAQSYANDKNIAIGICRYEYDEDNQGYEYIDTLMGFYGIDAAKYLGLDSQIRKYGLIIV